jgi:hypothetical protein
MPEVRSADWSKIKFRCQVIAVQDRETFRVQVEDRDIEFDEQKMHGDYLGAQICSLNGKQIWMRAASIPNDLRRLNAVFWIAHDNAIAKTRKRLTFRHEADSEPEIVAATDQAEW